MTNLLQILCAMLTYHNGTSEPNYIYYYLYARQIGWIS